MKEKTFWYNPRGSDYNGNHGPDWDSPGWLCIKAISYDEAVTKLPASEQAKVSMRLQQQECSSLEELCECTAGMGDGFTLRCEDNDEMEDFEQLPTTFTYV